MTQEPSTAPFQFLNTKKLGFNTSVSANKQYLNHSLAISPDKLVLDRANQRQITKVYE